MSNVTITLTLSKQALQHLMHHISADADASAIFAGAMAGGVEADSLIGTLPPKPKRPEPEETLTDWYAKKEFYRAAINQAHAILREAAKDDGQEASR